MPSGPVHYSQLQKFWPVVLIANAALDLIVLACAREWIWYALEFNAWSLFWFWAARYFDPDLDQPGITAAEGRMVRELGMVGILLASYFAFYAHFMNYLQRYFKFKGGYFGAHQSALTHSFLGTVIRMVFLFLPVPYLFAIARRILYFISDLFGLHWNYELELVSVHLFIYLAAQLLTLGYADHIHTSLDRRYGER